ncbi:MAG: thermonuclease family protein [Eubacteriales bacterium]
MNRKLSKVILVIVIALVAYLLVTGQLGEVIDILLDSDSAITETPTASANIETDSDSASLETDVAPSDDIDLSVPSDYSAPVLPDMDLSDKDLFEDGIAIVTLDYGIDGDTVAFIVGGKSYHLRMLGIDTPEVDENLRQLDPWGKAASSYTKTVLKNASQIVLQLDPQSDTFDKYGRLLGWVWVDGELHNYNVVAAGLAEVAYLYGDYIYTDDLKRAQAEAQEQGLKIWGEKDPNYEY